MNTHASETARADHEDLLREIDAVFTRNMVLYRHIPEDKLRAATAKGPFIASEAREAGFVDGLAFDDEIERVTQELVQRNIKYEKYEEPTLAPDVFGARGKIAVVHVDGDIVDGRSQHIPIVDTRLVGSYSMAETIKQVREDPMVKAVVLRIDSPGGSSLASDVMWRELVLLGQTKPLIVSMGSVAASGGYYIASASRNIYALPLTVTGSIGIFYGKADVSGLLDKIGVNVETYKTAPRADAESLYRPFTPDEKVELEHKVEQFYDVFLDRVSRGRGMTKAAVDAIGRGRVWTGQQALERHLVDHMGGLRHALDAAREASGLASDAPVVELPREEVSIVEQVVKLATGGRAATTPVDALPAQVRALARALAPMAVYRADQPLARMEWVDLDEGGR
jgi:protease-4